MILCISKDFQCSDSDHYNTIPEKSYFDRIWAVKAKEISTQEQESCTKINSEVETDISLKVYLYYADLFQDNKCAQDGSSFSLSCLMLLFLAALVV